MKSIFDKTTREDLIERINAITPNAEAQWGKMNPYQMIKHCILSEEMLLGKKKYERLFIGRLFGKMALNGVLKDDSIMKKNLPTHPQFKIKETGNPEPEKQKWANLVKEYSTFSNPNFVHPFFGKMTQEQIGNYVYKHTDHHLRQFNS